MILPAKHLPADRCILSVGARVLECLNEPKTVSAVWENVSRSSLDQSRKKPALRYDAFVLALDLLYLIGAVELDGGLLGRTAS